MISILIFAFVFIGLSEGNRRCNFSSSYHEYGVRPVENHIKSHYICDEHSALVSLNYESTFTSRLGCNGVNLDAGDSYYDVVYQPRPHHKIDHERIHFTNYTVIHVFKSGNYMVEECGTVVNGPCAGDHMWSTGFYEADDQNGCYTKGVTSQRAVQRHIQIDGKCASKCTLGSSHRKIINGVDALHCVE